MTTLIVFFLLSIVFSFLCSIWEAVLLSITPSYIRVKEKESPSVGKLISTLKKDIDKPLSAILTLNTIAHTVGAIGVGAQAGALYGSEPSLFDFKGISLTYESIIAALMTLAILFLSEIIPKTIGANNWEALGPSTARSLKIIMFVLTPFVWISYQLTKILKKEKSRSVLGKQDFAAMAEVVSEEGGIEEEDLELIKNVLQFDDLTVKDVMTPKRVMVMAEETQTLQEFFDKNKPFVFSRIPLYLGSQDNITGILLKDEVLYNLIENKGGDTLKEHAREAITVHASTSLRDVFQTFNDRSGHMGLVMDEFGTVIGLVTLEDVIETLFGLEIMDETDTIDDLRKYAREKWVERAKKLGLIESS